MTFQNNDALVRNMDSYFISRNDRIARLGMAINTFQNIPGLVGFWPMSGVQRSTGDAYDLSYQGRTLTYNGNPEYNIFNDLAPYIDLDGTGDFLSRADETDLQIAGNETIYASSIRGLTFGGWFWFDNISGVIDEYLLNKFQDYILVRVSATNVLQARFFNPMGGQNTANSGLGPDSKQVTEGVWSWVVGRFVPGVSVDLYFFDFVSKIKYTDTSSIATVLRTGANSFAVGAQSSSGLQLLNGQASFCFLSANALSDAYINVLFQQTRMFFGV